MEVSNTCGNSDLAWLKFRAHKYCNKCHGGFFLYFGDGLQSAFYFTIRVYCFLTMGLKTVF